MIHRRNHSRAHNEYNEIRPETSVPPQFLYFTIEQHENFLIEFYYAFRGQEEFDNAGSGYNTRPARLDVIYDCYVDEWNRKLTAIRDGTIILPPKTHISRPVGYCMGKRMFHAVLENVDEDYIWKAPSPTAKIDNDMIQIGEKDGIKRVHDGWYFKDNTPSNPVMYLESSK
jgi:hypothetical protein